MLPGKLKITTRLRWAEINDIERVNVVFLFVQVDKLDDEIENLNVIDRSISVASKNDVTLGRKKLQKQYTTAMDVRQNRYFFAFYFCTISIWF